MSYLLSLPRELFAWVLTLLFIPWGLRRHPPVGASKTPILLVHGFFNGACSWPYFQKRLAKTHGPIFTLNLGQPLASIRDHAQTVALKAKEIALATGSFRLILIGHSMGGLVSAYYATHFAPPRSVAAIVALGSPWRGTHLARFAPGASAREMRPNSPFLASLLQSLKTHPEIPLYAISSSADLIILPHSSAHPPEHPHLLLQTGHQALLFHPTAIRQIATWLDQ